MLAQFQSLYPTASLITELLQIYQGKYIVRSSVQIEGVTRATGMAAAEVIEEAEDRSRARALMVLAMSGKPQVQAEQKQVTDSPKPSSELVANNSLATPVVEKKEPPTTGDFSPEVIQASIPETPPAIPPEAIQASIPETPPVISPEVTQNSDVSSTPELFSAEDNSDIYSQEFDKPLPIQTYNEPEFDVPVEKTDIPSHSNLLEEESTASNKTSTGKTTKKTTKTSTTKRKKKSEPIDLSDVIAKTDVEMERLGWTPQQGREYLIQTYSKRGRTLLTEEELIDFLKYLESQPTKDLLETDPLAGF